VRSDQVTRRRARIVKERLEPIRDYLIKLHERMRKRHFHPDDELMALVAAADLAMQNLCNDLTIRSLEGLTTTPTESVPPAMDAKSQRTFKLREKLRESRDKH
jgi:hypothetical protein